MFNAGKVEANYNQKLLKVLLSYTIVMKTYKKVCGIDEAGRGPLAGSLVVAGVVLEESISGLCDSKQLSPKRRELLYEQIVATSSYHIVRFGSRDIDRLGLSHCLLSALEEIKNTLKEHRYIFDGNSAFGASGIETVVKADTKIDAVSAASILAKVTRDREMVEYSKLYPKYGFESHKGYGSTKHIDAIREFGYCDIHRKSFKIRALQDDLD